MNPLPDLPQVLNKREAGWTTRVLHPWIMKNPIPSGPIEVKYATTDYLPFTAVASHQLAALLECMSDRGFWWKIPDLGQRNPFDAVFYRNSPAWIVIKYPKDFVGISARQFHFEMNKSKKKSLTFSRAKEICVFSGKL